MSPLSSTDIEWVKVEQTLAGRHGASSKPRAWPRKSISFYSEIGEG